MFRRLAILEDRRRVLSFQRARPALELQLLVREPEGVQDRGYFLLQIGGSWWAPCTMIADKTAYAEVNDAITRARLAHDAVGGVVAANFALDASACGP